MMPPPLKEAYFQANPDPEGFQAMFGRDVARMKGFRDIPDADIQRIRAPALVINGDHDIVRVEHAVALWRALPKARLAVLPSGHGDYLGEVCAPPGSEELVALTVAMIEAFLDEPSEPAA